jgi:hypothetical protein
LLCSKNIITTQGKWKWHDASNLVGWIGIKLIFTSIFLLQWRKQLYFCHIITQHLKCGKGQIQWHIEKYFFKTFENYWDFDCDHIMFHKGWMDLLNLVLHRKQVKNFLMIHLDLVINMYVWKFYSLALVSFDIIIWDW